MDGLKTYFAEMSLEKKWLLGLVIVSMVALILGLGLGLGLPRNAGANTVDTSSNTGEDDTGYGYIDTNGVTLTGSVYSPSTLDDLKFCYPKSLQDHLEICVPFTNETTNKIAKIFNVPADCYMDSSIFSKENGMETINSCVKNGNHTLMKILDNDRIMSLSLASTNQIITDQQIRQIIRDVIVDKTLVLAIMTIKKNVEKVGEMNFGGLLYLIRGDQLATLSPEKLTTENSIIDGSDTMNMFYGGYALTLNNILQSCGR